MKTWVTGKGVAAADISVDTGNQTGRYRGTRLVLRRRIIWWAVMLFVLLEILDALMTNWAINAGIVREGNPLLTQMAGGWSFMLLKFTGAGLSAITLLALHKYFPRLSLAAAAIISVYYTAVLLWNSGIVFHTWFTW